MRTFKNVGKAALAVMLLTAIVISMAVLVRIVKAAPVDTYHSRWERIKDSATEDGANFATTIDLASNEGVWASKTSEAYHIKTTSMGQGYGASIGGAWVFAFYGTTTNDDTFSFTLVGWAQENGMAQIICEGDGILGTQDVVTEPNGDAITNGLWADTINLDETTKWPSVAVYNSGDNQVAIIVVDLTGLEWIDFVTYGVDGGTSGGEADTLGVYGRRY